MAIFGRRQPHAPIVLRGLLPAQGPVGIVVVPRGQAEARAAAERFYHRQFPPQVVRGGGPPALGRGLVVGQKTGQQAAQRYYHPQFAPIRRGAGAPPPTARLVFARGGVAPAADRYFRRSFPPTQKTAGPPPSVARQITVQRVSQPAARRPDSFALSLAPRVVAAPVTNAPVGRALLFGARAGQHAADRCFRRSFPPAVRTPGPPPSVARQLAVQRVSQPAARRPDGFALILPPRVVNPPISSAPVGRTLLFGTRAGQHAADRYFRRSFAPVQKAAGAPPSVARQVAVQKVSQPAARRPDSLALTLAPRVVAAPVVSTPVGRAIVVQKLAGWASRRPAQSAVILAPRTLAAPTPPTPTPGTVNPYWNVLRAVADVLAGVPGCPAPSVREIPYVLGGADRPPLCFVCPGEGGERLARQTFRKGAWWDYPVVVLLISAGNRVLRAGVEARLQLREDVRQALFVPRLDATTTVMDVDCRPKAAADVRAALGTQYVVSGFQLTYRHVEQRER